MGDVPLTERMCRQCQTLFRAERGQARFCSAKCRNEWHNGWRAKVVGLATEMARKWDGEGDFSKEVGQLKELLRRKEEADGILHKV